MSKQPTYYKIFPAELSCQVDEVIRYLTYFPFEKPEQCPRCASKSFYARRPTQQKIITYHCYHCDKEFNRLTETPFARCRFMDLWGKFAKARFSGKTTDEIVLLLGISKQAVSYRDDVLMRFLEQSYPYLHAWWKPYHDRTEKYVKNTLVEQEIKALNDWLKTLISTNSIFCPECTDKQMRKVAAQRLSFCCDRCGTFLSLLKGTPLYKLSYMDKWLPFVKLLIQGDSDSDIFRKLNISLQTSKRWRTAFLTIIKQQKLDNLYEWIIWQRRRRTSQAINDAYKKKNKVSRI